jgi:hypothetical protein
MQCTSAIKIVQSPVSVDSLKTIGQIASHITLNKLSALLNNPFLLSMKKRASLVLIDGSGLHYVQQLLIVHRYII